MPRNVAPNSPHGAPGAIGKASASATTGSSTRQLLPLASTKSWWVIDLGST